MFIPGLFLGVRTCHWVCSVPAVGSSALKSFSKQQQSQQLLYIQQQSQINNNSLNNNHHLGMFGNDHHDVSVYDPMHLSSRLSPVSSSMGSMPSPGSPPTSTAFFEKLPPGLAITALAAAGSRPSLTPSASMNYPPMSPSPGGGKMKSPSSGSGRKKAPVTEVGQEDEELLNIPSLQVRISILQQRVTFLFSQQKMCL